jgi:hypothetical protein
MSRSLLINYDSLLDYLRKFEGESASLSGKAVNFHLKNFAAQLAKEIARRKRQTSDAA